MIQVCVGICAVTRNRCDIICDGKSRFVCRPSSCRFKIWTDQSVRSREVGIVFNFFDTFIQYSKRLSFCGTVPGRDDLAVHGDVGNRFVQQVLHVIRFDQGCYQSRELIAAFNGRIITNSGIHLYFYVSASSHPTVIDNLDKSLYCSPLEHVRRILQFVNAFG
ncbi:hypothetical protein SDC9_111750 [bioreactor metagenome]|uniref:Uncharacterized protein n=1 Tax=bioreactor metagenome TaxID=1076179 RepID=A0A645BHA8_9ZZZZ